MRRDRAECSPCGGRTTRSATDGEIPKDLSEGSQGCIEGAARRPLWPGCEDRRGISSITTSAEVRQMSIRRPPFPRRPTRTSTNALRFYDAQQRPMELPDELCRKG